MMEDIPDFNLLKTFLAVVDQNGIGNAARVLAVSQPHVSQQMRRLEEKLGHRLFTRHSGNIKLNSDGEALVIFARSMLAVAGKVRDFFSQPRVAGSIRIGLTEDFARTALPRILYLFSKSYPDFHVEIETSQSSQQLFRQLQDGRFDLVIGKCLEGHTQGELLWREPLVWLGREDHRGVIEDPIPLVVTPAPSEARDMVIEALHRAGRSWRARFQSQSFASLEAAVEAGFGVAAGIRSLGDVPRVAVLDENGLPPLPDVAFYIDCRSGEPGVAEFVAVLRTAILLIKDASDDAAPPR